MALPWWWQALSLVAPRQSHCQVGDSVQAQEWREHPDSSWPNKAPLPKVPSSHTQTGHLGARRSALAFQESAGAGPTVHPYLPVPSTDSSPRLSGWKASQAPRGASQPREQHARHVCCRSGQAWPHCPWNLQHLHTAPGVRSKAASVTECFVVTGSSLSEKG